MTGPGPTGVVYPRDAVNWVDLVLLVAVVAAAVHGLRLGAMVQVLTFGGFWIGLLLGALLSIALVSSLRPGAVKSAVTLVAVLGLAVLFGTGGRVLGGWGNASLRRHHLGSVDSAFGVAVAVVAVLFSAWLVASVLSQSRYTWLSSAIDKSDVLHEVDDILPSMPSVFSHVQSFLDSEGFPSVFAKFPPAAAPPVTLPSSGTAQFVARDAIGSTVKVLGQACGLTQEGTAFVVAPHLVLTNAHVVAGEKPGQTEVMANGGTYAATPVYFDPSYDLALLRTDAPLGPPLHLAVAQAGRGTTGAVVGYPENGPLSVVPAGIAGSLSAVGRDIYDEGLVERQVYQIDAVVLPGNSGGPLLDDSGHVVGVVFSRSTTSPDVGYALASTGVAPLVDREIDNSAPVKTQACTNG
jgi:S1-C subfamily serine protease